MWTPRVQLGALIGVLVPGLAGANAPPDLTVLEATVRAELATIQAPGAAIAVVRGDEIVFAKGFGRTSLDESVPVTADTVFRVGSITKMFTAATLLTLVQEGRLRLDQPLGELIQGLAPALRRVTAHQLLTHTAGLTDDELTYGRHDPDALGRTVGAWTDAITFVEPGTVTSYSNPGLVLAGHLIEQLTRQPYDRVVQRRLLAPLDLRRTTFQPTVAMTYPLAQGHRSDDHGLRVVRPFPDNAGFWPAGFLFSTVLDLARFAMAIMSCGVLDDQQVLHPSIVERLTASHVDLPTTDRSLTRARAGYGVVTGTYRGVRTLEHGGSIEGFGALVRLIPAARVAVVALVNRTGGQLPRTVEAALELMLPLGPVPGRAQPVPMTGEEIDGYVGTYVNRATIELTRDGHELHLSLRTTRGGLELESHGVVSKIGPRRFAVLFDRTDHAEEFRLLTDDRGRVTFLHMQSRAFKRVDPPGDPVEPRRDAAPPR